MIWKGYPLLFLSVCCLAACPILNADTLSPGSSEEALFVRRILEFWKDNEAAIVKSQIRQFMSKYPHSTFKDSLLVILGDTSWNSRQYRDALNAYNAIQEASLREKVANNRLDCLYHLADYTALIHEIEPQLDKIAAGPETPENQLKLYYYAEACLQRAKKDPDSQNALSLYQTAQKIYASLLPGEHGANAKLALAEIEYALGDLQGANDLYLQLAEELPGKREELLFLAARAQAGYDPKQALKAFAEIEQSQGIKSSDAALSKLLLMFEMGQYQKILNAKDDIKAGIAPQQLYLADIYLGKSYFALEKYPEAISSLEPLLQENAMLSQDNMNNMKAVLITLIASAHHLNDLPKMEQWTDLFERNFSNEPEKAKVLYLAALTYKNCDRFSEALDKIDYLLRAFPNFEKMDNAQYERNLILFKQRKWSESRDGFLSYVRDYPSNPLCKNAWQYIPNATLQMLENPELQKEEAASLQEQLVSDLINALEIDGVIKNENKPKYQMKLAKTQYDLKQYDNAVKTLENYLQNYSENPQAYQAHLLLAMCCHQGFNQKKGERMQDFAKHAEDALKLKPDLAEQHRLRLNLYSTYLALAKREGQKNHSEYLDKAAEHLFLVLESGKEKVKRDNKLWLSNYLYDKAKQDANEYEIKLLIDDDQIEMAKRAIKIYQNVFGTIADNLPLIEQENLDIEKEYYKLSNLYGWLGDSEKRISILQGLRSQQESHPEWAWFLRSRTLFSLADSLRTIGQDRDALKIYRLLAREMKHADPYVAAASRLYEARMSHEALPMEKRSLDDPEMMAILNSLKDLQIRKSLQTEPIHLEAALDYAWIRSSLETENKRDAQMLFLLKRAKEDFSSKEDIWSKDYDACRKIHSEKELVYQAYMLLIDGNIANLQAKIAASKGSIQDSALQKEVAVRIYKNLLHDKFAVSKYLIDQAKSGLDALQ